MTMSPSTVPTLVLASTSRYRRELLQRLRLPFDVQAPHTDETPHAGEAPEALALRLAEAKARAVGALRPGAWVIGSDQVCACAGRVLGKPGSHAAALEQLQWMRGRDAVFHTALALLDGAGTVRLRSVPTVVRMRELSDAQLDAYLRAEQPYDCAGSAKSEGLGIALLESLRSDDPTALVGLPLTALCELLFAAAYPLLG
jgi:septum formation protein